MGCLTDAFHIYRKDTKIYKKYKEKGIYKMSFLIFIPIIVLSPPQKKTSL